MSARRGTRAHCEVDDWTFDPRYTQGRCLICGWVPEGAPAAPRWLALVNRLDWDMLGLFLLADVLVAGTAVFELGSPPDPSSFAAEVRGILGDHRPFRLTNAQQVIASLNSGSERVLHLLIGDNRPRDNEPPPVRVVRVR